VPHVLVPRRAWPDDRFPHWAVDALRAAGARVSDEGRRCDVAIVPAVRPAAAPRVRAGRVIGLLDVPVRPGDERLGGVDVVATSAALAWDGARVVRPAVPAGTAAAADAVLRIASVGPLHWSAGHEHAVVAAATLIAGGTAVELRVGGENGPAHEAILFAAFDLGIEHAVTVAGGEREAVQAADVVLVPAVEDRAWTGLLHAIACGVPAVASDLPTMRELGATVLAAPRDPAALAAAVPRAEVVAGDVTDLEACGRALLA
jgi:glycosyltransferase involved in cell wall biosynthesis